MRVAIDLDGVIYSFIDDLADFISAETKRPREELVRPTCWHFYEIDWGYTKKEYHKFAEDGVAAGAIWVMGDPLPGAIPALRKLRKDGHSVHLVTSRGFGRRARTSTADWLFDHKIPHDSLTFAIDKTILDVDVLLDDKIENVDAMREAGRQAFLFDQGYKEQQGHHYLVKDWEDFLAKVAAL